MDSLDPKSANLLQQQQQQNQIAQSGGISTSNGSGTQSSNGTVVAANNNDDSNTAEHYFITAADPHDGKLEDRLNEVINAKYEAGFLRPYNYVNGYARLQRYMDNQ